MNMDIQDETLDILGIDVELIDGWTTTHTSWATKNDLLNDK